MPKLSIITINYNNLEGLKERSRVVNQTWQEFEYLVIDGGSDGSAEYIESKKVSI
jgi:glycosyltransferase involved in cell wall biosynthesis